MVIAIAKLNVWSYIYFIIVIYLYMTKKTMKKFYYLLIFLIFSTIIQALFFLSNLTEDTDPDPDIEILNIVSKRLHIPWYKDAIISDAWGFFLGLGVGKTLQVNLIYMDFLLISFLYIYFYGEIFLLKTYMILTVNSLEFHLYQISLKLTL